MPQTPRQRKTNHWILTICTGGLWAPVWMLDWASRDH